MNPVFVAVCIGVVYLAAMRVLWLFLELFLGNYATLAVVGIIVAVAIGAAVCLYQSLTERLARMEQRLDSVEKRLNELLEEKKEE